MFQALNDSLMMVEKEGFQNIALLLQTDVAHVLKRHYHF
jgi:hypothetical protein